MDIQHSADQAISQIHQAGLDAPKTILFGSNSLDNNLADLLKPWRGRQALLVLGRRSARSTGLLDRLMRILSQAGLSGTPFSGVYREPTVDIIREGMDFARMNKADLVIGIGGGSVIDSAKALAALAVNPGDVEDYLEGVGCGRTLEHDPLPFIAIPTTAGTGAEMTRNAVITSLQKKYKKSMRDTRMIADAVIIDPALTRTVSREATASGGLDTITQLIESCITRKRRPITTSLALDALANTLPALAKAVGNPGLRHAREQLAYASFISGVCLANSGLGMAHGIAAGLGALCDVPHGLACGIMLPHTLDYLKPHCEQDLRQPLSRLQGMFFPAPEAVPNGIDLLHRTNRQLGIPRNLTHLYLKEESVRALAEASMGSSMSGCPIEPSVDQVHQFLLRLC